MGSLYFIKAPSFKHVGFTQTPYNSLANVSYLSEFGKNLFELNYSNDISPYSMHDKSRFNLLQVRLTGHKSSRNIKINIIFNSLIL